ncbi:hypothetical protein [Kitasatospora sp. NPDC002040]|uniref:hypothetical protein n=1 Tax=Kitasatospora sp. NPDC002040 TaxID=3154661 RepID=UPI00331E4B40
MDGIAWLAEPGAVTAIMKSGTWDPAKLPADRPEGLGMSGSPDGWFHARPPEDGSALGGDMFYFSASENAVYFSVLNPVC